MVEFEFDEVGHRKELDYIRKLLGVPLEEKKSVITVADINEGRRFVEEYNKNLEVLDLEQPDGSFLKAMVLEDDVPILFGEGPFLGCSYTCPSCIPLDPVYTSNTLSLFQQYTLVEGDFLITGVGTRDTGGGTLTISPPVGATIVKAWLYWNIIAAEGIDVTNVIFAGNAINGSKIGEVGNTCWPCNEVGPIPSNTPIPCPPESYTQLKNRIYRSDVGPTGYNLVMGSGGSYEIGGLPFTMGMAVCHNCPEPVTYPGCCGSQGAVLFIIYEWNSVLYGPTDHAQRFRQITLYDGGVNLAPPGTNTCYPGPFVSDYTIVTPPTQYILFPTVAFAAGDAQSYPDNATFNGQNLASGPSFFSPNAGNLLAIIRQGYNALPPVLTAAPMNTVTATTTNDCVSWFLWAMSAGDPHFYGFEGDRFDLHGEPNKYYNLFSDKNIQINALFKEWEKDSSWTSMGQIGIKVGRSDTVLTKILVDVDRGIFINGVELERSFTFRTGIGRNLGYIGEIDEWPMEYDSDLEGFGDFIKGYRVRVEDYEFIVAITTDGYHGYYLNFLGRVNNREARPHGIVGQTADGDGKPRIGRGSQGEGAIDGVYQDYQVSNLWADDFRYSRYDIGGRDWLFR